MQWAAALLCSALTQSRTQLELNSAQTSQTGPKLKESRSLLKLLRTAIKVAKSFVLLHHLSQTLGLALNLFLVLLAENLPSAQAFSADVHFPGQDALGTNEHALDVNLLGSIVPTLGWTKPL